MWRSHARGALACLRSAKCAPAVPRVVRLSASAGRPLVRWRVTAVRPSTPLRARTRLCTHRCAARTLLSCAHA